MLYHQSSSYVNQVAPDPSFYPFVRDTRTRLSIRHYGLTLVAAEAADVIQLRGIVPHFAEGEVL